MKRQGPPKLFHALFRWYCDPLYMQHIEGDLLEIYNERVVKTGRRNANFRFIIDVIRLFRPSIIRRFTFTSQIHRTGMYKNHLITAWRNLIKNKAFSTINIAGLSLGLTCSILIGLWVHDELNINAFHDDIEQIFVVTSCEYSGTEVNGSYDTPGLLGDELPKVFPEVEFAANYGWTSYHTFATGDKKMRLPGNFAGADFFNIFSYPLILGSKDNLLKSPESIVISRKMATNFFGSPEHALDKSLMFETYKDLKITGVFEDLGDDVSDKFEYIVNWELNMERNDWMKQWENSGPTTFLKLKGNSSIENLRPKLQHFLKKYSKDYSASERLELDAQPYAEQYLHGNFRNGKISGGRIEYVNLFRLVAIFIMIIACINFMNLSTARSVKRAKEIGIRKAIGAIRMTLISQFTFEAFLFTVLATVAALGLLTLALPQFSLLTSKHIVAPFQQPGFWVAISALTITTGLLAGSYPALVLSSFKPSIVLKGMTISRSSSGSFRKGLVIFQFVLSITFIVGMIVISRQVEFIQTSNIGYQKSTLLYMPITEGVGSNFEVFKQQMLQQPGIISVSKTSARPVQIDNSTSSVEWEGKEPGSKPTFTTAFVGYDYLKTIGAQLVAGRDFSRQFSDSANFIVNETALQVMAYKDPIGMPLSFWGKKGTIVGVVKDFHFNSLHVPIRPLVLQLSNEKSWGWVLIRTEPGKNQEAVASLEKVQSQFSPNTPFTFQFGDEEYQLLYENEQVIKQLSKYFAAFAILISCLGLLGLVIFTAEQRTREISIRKVLGASVGQIIAMLSSDFIKLVLVAVAISFPLGYYAMKQWLAKFQYHINMEWWMFALAGAGAIIVALVTVMFQAFKAAMANPISNLKSE